MTIKKRLFISNVFMVVVPIIIAIITVLLCAVVLNWMLGGTLFEILKSGKQQFRDPEFQSTLNTQITLVLLFAFAGIIFLIYFTNRFLTRFVFSKINQPLEVLANGVHQINDGNFDYRIAYNTDDEFKPICEDFNNMAARLSASVEEVQKNEKNRNEMLAGISHDLRTPLTSIKSYVKGLRVGVAESPEKQEEYLDVIYRKSCEMEELIEQLFLFSKLETGHFPFQFKPVPIQNYIVTLLDSLEYDLQNNHAEITLNINCETQNVSIDGEQMRRVISNIVYNSIKHNHDKDIHINVALYQESDSVFIRIKDDGTGVPEQQLPRLFDSFYRGDEARSNPSSGSGLGLSIAKMIVAAHCGKISAENDNGLAITIRLPIETEEKA